MNLRTVFQSTLLAGLLLAALPPARAQNSSTSAVPDNYRLMVRDQIEIVVFGQASLGTTQRIDADGQVKLNLLGTIILAGKTVRETEDLIERLYVERRLLREPIVTIRVAEYAPREVLINGAIGSPGSFAFPPEAASVDIVEVITKSGGFTPIAKSNAVRVTRFAPKGPENFSVAVRDMMIGRSKEKFFVQPGDIIWVDEVPF